MIDFDHHDEGHCFKWLSFTSFVSSCHTNFVLTCFIDASQNFVPFLNGDEYVFLHFQKKTTWKYICEGIISCKICSNHSHVDVIQDYRCNKKRHTRDSLEEKRREAISFLAWFRDCVPIHLSFIKVQRNITTLDGYVCISLLVVRFVKVISFTWHLLLMCGYFFFSPSDMVTFRKTNKGVIFA